MEQSNQDKEYKYLLSAANHALVDGDVSAMDRAASGAGAIAGAGLGASWGAAAAGPLGAVVGGIIGGVTGYDWRITAATAVSSANQLYNSGVSLLNMLPSIELEEQSAHEWIRTIDDDLAGYYLDNQQGIDTAGFVAGSIPAGLGAIKMLKAMTAAGAVGANMSAGTGLLGSQQAKYLNLAKEQMKTVGTSFDILNKNMVAAIGYGYGDALLQSAVFELGVQVAFNASPILREQDASDIAKNMFYNTLLGGAIGGTLGAVTDSLKVIKELAISDVLTNSARVKSGVQAGTPTSEKILAEYNNRFNIKVNQLPENTPDAEALVARMNRDAIKATNMIDNNIRSLHQELAGGDDAVGNMFHQMMNLRAKETQGNIDALDQILRPVTKISRIGTITKEEQHLIALRAKRDLGVKLSANEIKELDSIQHTYAKVWGPELGAVKDAPGLITLWDKLRAGDKLKVTNNGVSSSKGTISINFALNQKYNAVKDALANPDNAVIMANARTLWSSKYKHPLVKDFDIDSPFNIPMMEKAYSDMVAGKLESVKISGRSISSAEDMHSALEKAKVAAFTELKKSNKFTDEQIAEIINVRHDWINNTGKNKSLLGMQSYIDDYANRLTDVTISENSADIALMPRTVKVQLDTSTVNEYEQLSQPFQVYAKQKQELYKQDADRAVANALGGEWFNQLPDAGADFASKLNRNFAGSTTFRPAGQQGYDSAGAWAERVGAVSFRIKEAAKESINTLLDPLGHAWYNDINKSAELASIVHIIRSSPEKYIVDVANSRIIHMKYAKHLADPKKVKAPIIDGPLEIPVKSPEILKFLDAHKSLNSERVGKFASIRALNSGEVLRDPDVLYFPPPDLNSYEHFAFVRDKHIMGTDKVHMIWADTPERLEEIIATIPQEFKAGVLRKPTVSTGKDIDDWKKAIEAYNRDDAITDNFFSAAMAKSGKAARYLPQTDGKLIFNQIKSWHTKQASNLIEESIGIKYAPEFMEIKHLADMYANAQLSTVSAHRFSTKAKSRVSNPYLSYVNTALANPNMDQIIGRAFQDFADKKVSQLYEGASKLFDQALGKKGSVEELEIVNRVFMEHGINHVSYDAVNLALANHTIAKGSLGTFTRRLNGIIAGVTLGWDAIHGVVTRVGQMVMLAPEIRYLNDAISAKDAYAVGRLANVNIPGGSHSYFSPLKLIGEALIDVHKAENKAWAASKGFSVRHLSESDDIIDTLARGMGQRAVDLDDIIDTAYGKIKKFTDAGTKITGNLRAEELTRVVSALIAKKYTDLAVEQGIIGIKEADNFINLFVNRTNGVHLSMQKPMMFNGPVGQAMGLFQNYYVTMLNNLFRYAAEGHARSAATMLAAQSFIFGAGGLPLFQAINSYAIGGFASNSGNNDIYSLAYKSMDKNMADWLLYGALSNAPGIISHELKTNMYVRGDINPRNISIVPLNPADFAAVSISAKFFNNLYDTFDMAVSGVPISQVLLRGMEHNGISRPLAGLAQVLQAATNEDGVSYSTTSSGSLIGTNDVMSLTNLARIAGAKPLDDAIAQEESYRQLVYSARQQESIKNLGKKIKASVAGNKEPSDEDIEGFAMEYIKRGGKQEGFNRFYANIFKEANMSISNKVTQKLSSPESQRMQLLMGGKLYNDFYHTNEY